MTTESFMDQMKAKMAKSLKVHVSQIGIKATTTEKMDSVGAGEAIAAYAVCLVTKKD